MGDNGSTMHNRLYGFHVFCALIIIASASAQQTEVEFSHRKAVLQIANCSNKESQLNWVKLVLRKPEGQDQLLATWNTRTHSKGTSNYSKAIVVWVSPQKPISLSAAWEQSDFLDTQGNNLMCKISNGSNINSFSIQARPEPATRWEWSRPKGPADAQKKVFIEVEFSCQGNQETVTACISEQCAEADGMMRRFPAKTDHVILYLILENDKWSRLVVLLPKVLESSVENVHCRVKIDGHSSICPGPGPTESPATGLHPECCACGISGTTVTGIIVAFVVGIIGLFSSYLCYQKGKRQAQGSGPAKVNPVQHPLSGSRPENENSEDEDAHYIVSIR